MAYVDRALLKIAFYKGYCTIYSNYHTTEQAKQQVANELTESKHVKARRESPKRVNCET